MFKRKKYKRNEHIYALRKRRTAPARLEGLNGRKDIEREDIMYKQDNKATSLISVKNDLK